MASKRRPIEPEPEPVFESLDLIAAVEKRLTKRQSLQDEIAAIDDELRRVYERIGQDRPAQVAAPPAAPAPAPAAVAAVPRAASPRTPSTSPRAQAVKADRAMTSHHRGKWPKGESIQADVLKAVGAGHEKPRHLWMVLDWGRDAIKAACRDLEAAGKLQRHGATHTLRFTVVEPKRPVGRTVISEGVELETVWSGRKTDPSLLGSRDGQHSSLAANA